MISLLKGESTLEGVGSDISKQAILVARENAVSNEVKASWVTGNMFEKTDGCFDMIVSNPPYIRSKDMGSLMPEIRDFEPPNALDGGEDGLSFYRILAKDGKGHLKEGGTIAMEIGADQGDDVYGIFEDEGYKDIEIVMDLAGHDRVVLARRGNEK